jgi:hypothetical protein
LEHFWFKNCEKSIVFQSSYFEKKNHLSNFLEMSRKKMEEKLGENYRFSKHRAPQKCSL